MNNPAENIMFGMIEGNLQQGWECLQNGEYALAKSHFDEASRQVDELAAINGSPVIEDKTETQPLLIDPTNE